MYVQQIPLQNKKTKHKKLKFHYYYFILTSRLTGNDYFFLRIVLPGVGMNGNCLREQFFLATDQICNMPRISQRNLEKCIHRLLGQTRCTFSTFVVKCWHYQLSLVIRIPIICNSYYHIIIKFLFYCHNKIKNA